MFSSEQVFEISGDIRNQLEQAIRFAIDYSGHRDQEIFYQVTKDGKYCLGWSDGNGWEKYPFDFDVHIVAAIVKQHLEKQELENPYEYSDGGVSKGFLMKVIPQLFSDEYEGIRNPFYGIVSIEPYWNYYAK